MHCWVSPSSVMPDIAPASGHAARPALAAGQLSEFWKSRRVTLMKASAAALLLLLYMLVWWNRYTGLSDGVFLMHAQQVLAGRVPYRDFYLPIPPLTVLKTAAIVKLSGASIVAPRAVALAERAMLAAALFCWLDFVFPSSYALLSTLASMVVFCGDYADQLNSYHHDSVFLASAAGICAGWLVRDRTTHPQVAAALCGLFCGLTCMTKQTTGAGITAALFVVIFLCSEHKSRSWAWIPAFCIGWALPVLAIGVWLHSAGALGAAVQAVLGKGTTSKGPLANVLVRPLRAPLVEGINTEPFVAAALLLAAVWLLQSHNGRHKITVQAFACVSVAVALGTLSRHLLLNIEPFTTYLGLLGTFAISLYYFTKRLRNPLTKREKQVWILSTTSFAIAYMLSLSWAAYQPMAVPSLAFVICFALSRKGQTRMERWLHLGFTAGTVTIIAAAVMLKIASPYGWVSWFEPPVTQATAVPDLKELGGLRLSPGTIRTLDESVSAIQSACGPTEPLFAYPYLPLLHVLSHRPPATFSYLPWFDVTPDYVAEQDARHLAERPPCAIAFFKISESDADLSERIFRGGQGSGQRRLVLAMENLARTYHVLMAQSFANGASLTIYGRLSGEPSSTAIP